jgi:hypothetical protein
LLTRETYTRAASWRDQPPRLAEQHLELAGADARQAREDLAAYAEVGLLEVRLLRDLGQRERQLPRCGCYQLTWEESRAPVAGPTRHAERAQVRERASRMK